MTKSGDLSSKQVRAIEALLACDTLGKACEVAKISRTTMYRYLKDPVFDKEFKTTKKQMVNRAILRLQQTCGDASRALAEICRDRDAPPSSRVSAAREIIHNTLKAIELEEIEDRLQSLEEKYSKLK